MHLVIDRELASGPSLAVEKLAGMLNSAWGNGAGS